MAIIDNDFIAWRDEQREQFPQFFNDLSASRVHMAFREEVALAAFRAGKAVGRDRALSHAAGQEAVAFRFVSDGDAYNPFKPEWFDGTPEPHDLENAKRFPGVRIQYAYLTPAAPTNPAEIGRKSVGAGQEVVAVDFVDEIGRDGKPTGYIIREGSPAHASHELAQIHARLLTEADNLLAFAIKRSNLVTPAQPPASAEVGRDAAEDAAKLGAFVAEILNLDEDWIGDVDGGTLQDAAEKYGLLKPVAVTESCGEYCKCADYGDFPQDCYQPTDTMKRAMAASSGRKVGN